MKRDRPPKHEETIVIECLRVQGFTKIVFEPDGNVTPDILVNNTIAIEVRRLNNNVKVGEKIEGFEKEIYLIERILKKTITQVADNKHNYSAFINYSLLRRPFPDEKDLRKLIRTILEEQKAFIDEYREYTIGEYLIIKFYPSENLLEQQYMLGVGIDQEACGFVVGSIYKNLEHVIKDKERIVKEKQRKYSKWWLAVVDTIGYGLSETEVKEINELGKIESIFDRILLVSSLDHKNYCFLFE